MGKIMSMYELAGVLASLERETGLSIRCEAPTFEDLNDRLLDLQGQAEAIQTTADAENRELSEDEIRRLEEIFGEFAGVEQEIGRRQQLQTLETRVAARFGRLTDPDDAPDPETGEPDSAPAAQAHPRNHQRPRVPAQAANPRERANWGWRSMGQFAAAVRTASARGGHMDPRLMQNAPTEFGSEGQGEDGGFAVPPEFRREIVELIQADEELLSRTDQLFASGNSMTFPKDETTPWQTSGGIQAYWDGEAAKATESKPGLQDMTVKLHKCRVLVPVTEELLEDAPALDSYLRRKAPEKINFKITLGIVQGTGAGMPLGILEAPSTIVVPKENNQAADTITYENIVALWNRVYGPYRRRAVWLINQDIEPQLMTMRFMIKNVAGSDNVGGIPVYIPANSAANQPFSLLMGRPIIDTQACNTLGSKGDIILAGMDQYMTIQKTRGIRTEVSMHLWFDYDVTAFKFTVRLAGQPWLSQPIEPRDGSVKRSAFATLAERS